MDGSGGGVACVVYIFFVSTFPFAKVGATGAHPWRSPLTYINTTRGYVLSNLGHFSIHTNTNYFLWDMCSFFQLSTKIQLVSNNPTLEYKKGFKKYRQRHLHKVANKQRCLLQLEPLHSGSYSHSTRVAYIFEHYLRLRVCTHTFS